MVIDAPTFLVFGKEVAPAPAPRTVSGVSTPKPHKPFEKGLSENFTFLHLTQRGVATSRWDIAQRTDRAGRRDKG